jgi:hypothetical protein
MPKKATSRSHLVLPQFRIRGKALSWGPPVAPTFAGPF